MKKYIVILLAIATVGFASTSFAADLKVGVVDLGQVLHATPQVKTIELSIKKKFTPRSNKIKADEAKIGQGLQDFKRNASVWSKTKRSAEEAKLVKANNALQKEKAQFSQDLQAAQATAMQKVFVQIRSVVNSVAKKSHYNMVLQKSAVLYYQPSYDITKQVTRGLK